MPLAFDLILFKLAHHKDLYKSLNNDLNFDKIRPLTVKLVVLERPKISHRLTMGKWCLHVSLFILIDLSLKFLVTRTSKKVVEA